MEVNNLKEAVGQIALLEDAIGSCKCGVTIADAIDPEMPLIYINGAFSSITGYPVEEVIGKNCRFLQGEDRDQETRQQIREALATGSDLTVVLRNYRPDGEQFYNELHLSPIRRDGKVTHFVGIQNDVTDVVEAKLALEEANAKKDKLLGMAAHDLRNPLAMIKSLAELARDSEEADAKEMLEMVADVSDKAMSLVNDILDLSAVQEGIIQITKEPVDLREFLDRFSRIAGEMAKLKGITFEENRQLSHSEVTMDADRVEQVLDNLVTNAIKFSNSGTKILLTTLSTEDALTFEVTDQGQGIPAEEQHLLFKEFSSTSVQPTGDEHSSGLGLAITRRLVDLHGGRIEVESAEGKGSTFRVIFEGA